MKLSNKNKKMLENLFDCQIDFDHVIDSGIDCYNAWFANKVISFSYDNYDNCYVFIDPTLFDIINSCDKFLIINRDNYHIEFKFINDLKNIKI